MYESAAQSGRSHDAVRRQFSPQHRRLHPEREKRSAQIQPAGNCRPDLHVQGGGGAVRAGTGLFRLEGIRQSLYFTEEQSYQAQHYSNIDANFPFTKDSRRKDIINQLCSLQVESLLDTADLLNEAPLDECAALLLGSRRVAMFGLNPNFALAELFKRKMLSIGRQVELPSQGDVGLLAHSLDKYDCAVIISYSGNSPTTGALSVLPTLKQRNVPIIGITSVGDNLLRQKADYTLSISSYERLYSKISTFGTENSILFILNVLFSICFAADYDANLERKIGTARELESTRRVTNEQALKET